MHRYNKLYHFFPKIIQTNIRFEFTDAVSVLTTCFLRVGFVNSRKSAIFLYSVHFSPMVTDFKCFYSKEQKNSISVVLIFVHGGIGIVTRISV
jgi:hypothetical protein